MRSPAILLLALAVLASTSLADSIFQSKAFGGSPGLKLVSFNSFDPTLGTLDGVNVSIFGTYVVSGSLGQTGSPGQPVPTVFTLNVDHWVRGSAGRAFNGDSAKFLLNGIHSGIPGIFTVVINYSYNFTLNATTDVAGFIPGTPAFLGSGASSGLASGGVVPIPPALISGTRSDFLPIVPSGDPPIELQIFTFGLPVGFLTGLGVTQAGNATIRYDYTPAAPPVEPVPEPSTTLLLAAAAAVVAGRKRFGARGFRTPDCG